MTDYKKITACPNTNVNHDHHNIMSGEINNPLTIYLKVVAMNIISHEYTVLRAKLGCLLYIFSIFAMVENIAQSICWIVGFVEVTVIEKILFENI